MSQDAKPKKQPTIQSIAIAVLGVGSIEAKSLCDSVPAELHPKILELYQAGESAETIRSVFYPAKEETLQQNAPVDPPQEKVKSGKSK